MQPDNTPPNMGRVAFRYGLIIGIILAVVEAVIVIINAFVSLASLAATNGSSTPNLGSSLFSLGLSGVGLLLGLTAYFVAGILAARQTGRVSTGVFAGMWTGAFYGVIIFVVSQVLLFTVTLGPTLNRLSYSATRIDQLRTITIAASLIGGILGIAFAVGFGAGLGALGGLVGRNSWRKTHPQPAFPPPYPGQPYAMNMPMMPMQQYPAQGYPGPGYPPQQPPSYAPPQPWVGGAYPVNPEPVRPQPERPTVEPAEPVERTQLDTSNRSSQPESQGWSGTVPRPIPPIQESEPENPYSN
ncbi:MAG: hypothetical protein NVS4B9_17360 [Ktedonobacteraceae bacterium]